MPSRWIDSSSSAPRSGRAHLPIFTRNYWIEGTGQVTRHGDRALVSVRDRGPGLPPHEAKRIFKRFYRVPGPLTQRVKGTGLGLFIVQSAAKRHGGRAYAESSGTGAGSTFNFELPVAPPAATA